MSTVVQSEKLHENELVNPPRGSRKVATILFLLILIIPLVLIFAPWRQNVGSRGRVVAFDPVDRLQVVASTVTGRVDETFVQEGSRVEVGDPLVQMTDFDPFYSERLEEQLGFAKDKLKAARESASLLERRIASLTETQTFSVDVARSELEMAREKVNGAEQALLAAQAEYEQKLPDRTRKERLYAKKLTSELKLQKAVAASESAEAKVEEAKAKLEAARHEVSAKNRAIDRKRAEVQAKIDDVSSKLEKSRGEIALAEKEVRDSLVKIGRQETQLVRAKVPGVVFKLDGAGKTEMVKKGDPLLRIVPDTDRIAAELWLKGNDAPLVTPGREVRLQFEGWPAVQFVGWPSAARGTFGGVVTVVDSHDNGKGKFRILVEPDPNDVKWPSRRFLRQGVQVKGWVLLEEVSLGFEIWRQLNGFPPSLDDAPNDDMAMGGKK